MDEREKKMREVSIEMMKLRGMIGMDDLMFPTVPYDDKKERESWLFVVTGTKKDIIIFISMLFILPLMLFLMSLWLAKCAPTTFWLYAVMDVIGVAMWLHEAWRIKNAPEEEEIDKEAQMAIVKQKIAELKEIDERLKREELEKQQAEQKESEDQEG